MYNACFAAGLEISVDDMKIVVEAEPKLRAEAFISILDEYKVAIPEVLELVEYFTQTRRQKRPASFVQLPRIEYFLGRFLNLLLPVGAFFIGRFIPRLTTYEKEIFNITRKLLGCLLLLLFILNTFTFLLCYNGVSSIPAVTVATIFAVNSSVILGSQAARESMSCSKEATVTKYLWQRRLLILRHTPIQLKYGATISGSACISRMCSGGSKIIDYVPYITQMTPLAFSNQNLVGSWNV